MRVVLLVLLGLVGVPAACATTEEVAIGRGVARGGETAGMEIGPGVAAGVAGFGAGGVAAGVRDGGEGGQGGPEGTPVEARVVGFMLVDVATGADLGPLTDGDTIRGVPGVTVRALVEPPGVESVVFHVDHRQTQGEKNPPWVVSGNDFESGELNPWTIEAGDHTLQATPFDGESGTGRAGMALDLAFWIE